MTINEIQTNFTVSLEQADTLENIENLRIAMLGKKGAVTALLKSLGSLPSEERKEMGQKANELKSFIANSLTKKRADLESKELETRLINESIDITLPGKKRPIGSLHPVTIITRKLEDLFLSLGFQIAEGPHIESVYYNFDALNTPFNHPTREEADTFYVADDFVLRTHTSPVQVRTMERQEPPIRVISPGFTFRRDEIDATHTPVFTQMEGLVIDKGISMGDLKGMMEIFARYLFGGDTQVRLRPSYFPFTEPSAEVDISCYACKSANSSCRICKGSGWVEMLGCGMVHPKVLSMRGIDTGIYSGYAFGLGTSRIATAIYGIDDPRHLFENDMQFLQQF